MQCCFKVVNGKTDVMQTFAMALQMLLQRPWMSRLNELDQRRAASEIGKPGADLWQPLITHDGKLKPLDVEGKGRVDIPDENGDVMDGWDRSLSHMPPLHDGCRPARLMTACPASCTNR